jgi:hypothetical protein
VAEPSPASADAVSCRLASSVLTCSLLVVP